MNGINRFVSILIRFFLVIILIVGVAFIGLVTYYFITKKSATDYLPDTFIVYVKVNSIKDFYENVLDLKAAESVFAEVPQLAPIHKAITDFKSEKLARSFYFKKLLDVEVHAVIDSSQTPVLVFDPGLLSIPIQLFPFANLLVKIEGVNIDTIQRGKVTIYAISKGEKDKAYFSINNNLIFVSTKLEPIEKCYAIHAAGKTLGNNKEAQILAGKVQGKGKATIIVKTDSILAPIAQGNRTLSSVFDEISFNGYSALTFDISNTALSIEAFTSFETKNDSLSSFAAFSPRGQVSLTLIPDSASMYSSISPKSFKDLIRIVSAFKEHDGEKLAKQIDDACQLLFRKPADELIYGWMGSEAGLATIGAAGSPMIFIRLKDTQKFNEALSTIAGALLSSEVSTLVVDGVRLTKIVLPDFLAGLAGLFVKGFDTPYYIVIGDYVFFSMDPKNLAETSNSFKSNKTIVRDDAFRAITRDIPMNAHVSLYYNMESSTPDFLAGNSLVMRLLSNYKTGIISVFFTANEARVRIAATGDSGGMVTSCPGYPKALPGGALSDVLACDVGGSRALELAYVSRDSKLTLLNPIDGTTIQADVEPESDILAIRSGGLDKDEIYVLSGSGILGKFDGEAKPVSPFPLTSNFKGSFPLMEHDGRLVLFSHADKALVFVSADGSESKLAFPFEQPLLTQPSFARGIIAFYPKSFAGTVYCTDDDGTILAGWPKDGGGISYSSPILFDGGRGKILVAFITQSGRLTVWDREGSVIPGFPVDLDGVFVDSLGALSPKIIPEYNGGETKAIIALNTDGRIFLIDLAGTVLRRKEVPGVNGKNAKFMLDDYNKDGIEEIFIYGSSNYITGLGRGLELIPGFPVKGSTKCQFADIDADGRKELVTGSFDGNVYAYKLGI